MHTDGLADKLIAPSLTTVSDAGNAELDVAAVVKASLTDTKGFAPTETSRNLQANAYCSIIRAGDG